MLFLSALFQSITLAMLHHGTIAPKLSSSSLMAAHLSHYTWLQDGSPAQDQHGRPCQQGGKRLPKAASHGQGVVLVMALVMALFSFVTPFVMPFS